MKEQIPEPSELPPVDQDELDDIIIKHAMYLEGEQGGARAVVQYRDLSNLDFSSRDLSHSDFTGSMLVGANLSKANFTSTNFFACDLRNANLNQGRFVRADFRGAYIAGADLTGADLTDADMREGKIMLRDNQGILEDRKRSGGEGSKTIFTGAKLTGTNMAEAQAFGADFSDADLTDANLTGAYLSETSFEGANLTDANLSSSDLSGANMRSSIIAGTVMANTERAGLDISDARSEKDMGDKLENLGKSLPELLEEHTLWVATAGKSGRQLDLSGYDMREVVDLKRYPLTAIQAIEANFLNQDLSSAELQSGTFDKSDFRDCLMLEADLRGSSFKYANFSRVDLSGAVCCPLEFKRQRRSNRLQRVDFSGANLRYANLQGGDFRHCIFMGVDLTSAILQGADLRKADLTGAILTKTTLDGALLDNATIDLNEL